MKSSPMFHICVNDIIFFHYGGKYWRLPNVEILVERNVSAGEGGACSRPFPFCHFSTDSASSTRHDLARHDLVWFQAHRVSI